MTFHVGQKVVCVDASNYFRSDEPNALRLGAIYVVSEDHGWSINVAGIPGNYRTAFNNVRFRPVVEHKTDISIFKKMLTPKQRERTDA